ncbi:MULTISPECIES: DUF6807 family protein [Arthrobacter]|uniref:Oxidoreductase n=1 Tax=Arthrobacter terricola TaxID=2547396 RepID=A0A4R5KMF0_9MICC|nr:MULTISPECIES: DUF6807 family protein [Arthrobacter]MBT8161298.1 PmoA family protein [Arthrobacter sp. GN70]TDF96105.1 oxidoreductase [Arthrobacter terricola]
MGTTASTSPHHHPGPDRDPFRVALIGVHGFGQHHLDNLARLQSAGTLRLVAVADPNPPAAGTLPEETAVFSTADDLLAQSESLDLVIIATPIQTHAPLALAALPHADLYLEKPPVASLSDFDRLLEAANAAGRSIQVGFQSLGSHAFKAIDKLRSSGEIGTVIGISATGRWVRDRAYYKRSRWAGKRSLDGVDVVDGVATNPLAHAIATALHIAGARTVGDVASVETDLYRANRIESDDTSVIRIRTSAGLPITCALTLCATESVEPYITLQGTEGTAVFHYTEDRLTVSSGAGVRHESFGRDDLTENLLEYLQNRESTQDKGTALLSGLEDSGAFMRVVEAIRTAEPPAEIPGKYLTWVGEGDAARAVITGIEDALERATAAHATFSELALPWARPAAGTTVLPVRNHDGGTPGGDPRDSNALVMVRNGTAVAGRLSPRPYLHPVRTLAGVAVTDHLPTDHPWHLGVGIALQDVNGVNFWGGKTYQRESGRYEERPDHGRMVSISSEAGDGVLDQHLSWQAPDGRELLRERRRTHARTVDGRIWRLDLTTELAAVVDASLGGPGPNGAVGSGYGGFFWRFPPCTNADVFTAERRGEAEVHGSAAQWLAWTADFPDGPASVVFQALPEAADPWFVRLSDYPGVGSAMAWDTAIELAAGESVVRSFSAWIVDGKVSPGEAASLFSAQGRADGPAGTPPGRS